MKAFLLLTDMDKLGFKDICYWTRNPCCISSKYMKARTSRRLSSQGRSSAHSKIAMLCYTCIYFKDGPFSRRISATLLKMSDELLRCIYVCEIQIETSNLCQLIDESRSNIDSTEYFSENVMDSQVWI